MGSEMDIQRYNINGDIYIGHNFGGDVVGKGFEWNGSMGLKNYWNVWTGGHLSGNSLSSGMLRGGPMMKLPGNLRIYGGFSSDNRKKLTFQCLPMSQEVMRITHGAFILEWISLTNLPIFSFFTLSPGFNHHLQNSST